MHSSSDFDLTRQRLDEHLRVDRIDPGQVAQPRAAIAPVGDVAVVVGASALGPGAHLREHAGHGLHRMHRARVLEVDPDLIDGGGGLGVLLLHRGHDQGRLAARADEERDRTLGGDVVEAGEVGDAGRVEDAHRVETGGLHALGH